MGTLQSYSLLNLSVKSPSARGCKGLSAIYPQGWQQLSGYQFVHCSQKLKRISGTTLRVLGESLYWLKSNVTIFKGEGGPRPYSCSKPWQRYSFRGGSHCLHSRSQFLGRGWRLSGLLCTTQRSKSKILARKFSNSPLPLASQIGISLWQFRPMSRHLILK